MQEILGWILCGPGVLCGLRVMAISARHRVPLEFDRRSVFESKYQHHKNLQQVPGRPSRSPHPIPPPGRCWRGG